MKMQCKMTYWMESGMDSDISEHLETDEMYLMLQADMLSIKRQETALKSEIVEITSKFKNILTSCGIESQDYSAVNQTTGTLPPTPSFMRSSTLTHVTALSSDEDFLLQEMMKASLCSTSSESIYEDSAMTLIVDSNSNYVSSARPCPKIVSTPNIPTNVAQVSSSSDISNGSLGANTSDGYPKSTDTSSDDNQCVPDCMDLEQERMSRIQYYGDFTIDRQRCIDSMTVSLSTSPACTNLTSAATEELFTREVEGCEDKPSIPAVRVGPIIGACLPSNANMYPTTTSGSSSSTPSSSGQRRRRHSTRKDRTTSSKGSSKYTSVPCHSSTMMEDLSPSSGSSNGSSKHRSSSIPQASSTMISTPCSSEDDLQSIYTWSIHDNENSGDDDLALEESYFKNLNKMSAKPPLPSKKVLSSGSSSSSSSRLRRSSKRVSRSSIPVDSCMMPVDALSMIDPSATYRDAYLGAESMYDDDDFPFKSNSLPRTSTRINLLPHKSSGSSMEARCSSMPDIVSVEPANNDDFHSVPTSPDHSDDDTSPLTERLELPGKSSSSSPASDAQSNHPNTDALIDSILTDSPNSVCSSGIFVPCNTPDVTDHSKTSRSTTSDKSDTRAQLVAPPSSVASIPSNPQTDSGLFKVPKFNQPLRKLFKFKRSKAQKHLNILTSTPAHMQPQPSSVHSDPLSKRKLFPTAPDAQTADVQIINKRAVIKKFKKFSASFNRKGAGLTRIQTLANL